jgi:hypothetical protein
MSMKQRHIPIRSCVVCRQTSDKRELLRVVRLPEKDGGAVVSDPTGKKAGRGAYVCAQQECIEKARKSKRFERVLAAREGAVDPQVYEELMALAQARSTINTTSIRSDPPMK